MTQPLQHMPDISSSDDTRTNVCCKWGPLLDPDIFHVFSGLLLLHDHDNISPILSTTLKSKARVQTIQDSEHSQACQGSPPESRLGFGAPYFPMQIQLLLEWLESAPPKTAGLTYTWCDFVLEGCACSLLSGQSLSDGNWQQFVPLWQPSGAPLPLHRHLTVHHWHQPALLFLGHIPHPY